MGDKPQGFGESTTGEKVETMKCQRCTGLVVADHFIGGASPNGGWAYGGWRCVNCGAIAVSGQAGVHRVIRSGAGNQKDDRKSRAPGLRFRRP